MTEQKRPLPLDESTSALGADPEFDLPEDMPPDAVRILDEDDEQAG